MSCPRVVVIRVASFSRLPPTSGVQRAPGRVAQKEGAFEKFVQIVPSPGSLTENSINSTRTR